jgi:hypothetical protein
LGVFSTLERTKQFIQDRWNRPLQSSEYVMYGSDIMSITELELDNPDYEEGVEFNYGYDDQLIEKKNFDYWMRKRLEYY